MTTTNEGTSDELRLHPDDRAERPKDLVRWAIEIIRELHAGGLVTYRGQHFDVDSAEGWDLPDTPVEIGVIVEGGQHPVRAAQQRFLAEAAEPLLGRLRAAAP